MASAVLAQFGAKIFYKNIPGYAPPNPVYESYMDKDGEEKTRKRNIPAGLSRRDIQILQNVRVKAHKLDREFSIFGFTFGWGFIITLVPILGDILNLLLNYWLIVAQAQKAELPDWLATEMLSNQVISCGFGMIPILGDLVVAIFGCNSRNVVLLEEYLTIRGIEYLKPEGDRHYDPEDIKPGAGMERGESPSYHPTPASANPDQEPLINSKDWEV